MLSPMMTVVVLAVLWLIVVIPMLVKRNDFAVEEVDACRRRDVGDVDFTGFAAQTESLNLFSDTKKISEFDRVPAQIGKHA